MQVRKTVRRGAKNQNQTEEEVYDYDEISATFKVRYLTAMEAYLRLHSYRIVQMSHQIYTLSVHDEMGQTLVLEEGHEEEGLKKLTRDTRLTAFFNLCKKDPNAKDLTYDKVPYKYRYFFESQRILHWSNLEPTVLDQKHDFEYDCNIFPFLNYQLGK